MRTHVISIAGLDPSGGAGLTADIKTFEALGVQGLAVATAVTYQNEQQFIGLEWVPLEQIEKQLESILDFYPISGIKIGIIQNLDILIHILHKIRQSHPYIPIVWDPVRSASAGYAFHSELKAAEIEHILQNVDVMTPNVKEYNWLKKLGLPVSDCECAAHFVTGVQSDGKNVSDCLTTCEGKWNFDGKALEGFEKHGSGCVLSSALAAYLAKGVPMREACALSKTFARDFLKSTEGKLGTFNFYLR